MTYRQHLSYRQTETKKVIHIQSEGAKHVHRLKALSEREREM